MTTSEEKRLQNRKHQANYRNKPEYKASHRSYMTLWRRRKKCWMANALLTFSRLRFERMERQGV